jgi:hypothetical protein
MATIPGWVRDDEDHLRLGQVRMDHACNRLVVLHTEMYDTLPDHLHVMPWIVKDILSGGIYTRNEDKIGVKIYNEMEVLAWAAGEHPNVEILGD